ncbi:MAG: spermidine/putrescine ABC transporter permease PotC [Acidiferrobacteraceae bacterium]|jgi:spermidine/putrescine transport system permease protein|nr:spermidine/putrescine ABC transporter permease PotC [Acidiferrobacteraceae bacterium]MDP6398565.1 ABC transporter permease [Arenicellales bacterium]MDP6552968.1 ABC transporter permease [Arenicellales bacterium]MDP6791146.1 ABC transporter permease [Arenicellales bacterium]MDP6918854.1 ABC transporter permease [Arenicellales bacterium]|tara:strand:+ start:9765 stop:10589 length:825 start_codon:yes stop_codon:yes gene_type:complete
MAELLLTRGRRSFDVRYLPGFTPLAAFCLVALYLPLILVIFFSFNAERSITVFSHFGLNWYEEAAQNTFVQNATWLSLKLAFFATLVATTCATMAGLATTRRKPFPGQSVVYGVINQPLMIPEIVTAVALLAFFGAIKQATNVYGFGYLLLAHIVFCIPFAYMPIRARLQDMDLTMEQAAADLYASPWKVFRRVTLPMMIPGIIAGAMLSFVISFDDVIISMLVAGPGETTLPVWMIGQLRRGLTPQINAVSTVLLVITFFVVWMVFVMTTRKR